MNSSGSKAFRECFPLLKEKINGHNLIYFDNAATTQKPASVITAYQSYYSRYNANVHRASHALSAKSTYAFEKVRNKVQQHIGASFEHEIIWTRGTTESINLIAQSWGRDNIKAGDEIVLSQSEHHANIVPWQILAQETGAKISVLPLDKSGRIDSSKLDTFITNKAKVVSVAHISNVIGKINPIEAVIARAQKVGAISIIDGAQAIAHLDIDVKALGCDFYIFSAHKVYGPTGLGVLYGKEALLNAMPPYQAGGEMISKVSFSGTTFNQLPFKFEAGTPNIAAVVAFGESLSLFEQFSKAELIENEQQLIRAFSEKSKTLTGYKSLVSDTPDIAVFSFQVEGMHNQDVASALDAFGIAVRGGHHCAMPLMEFLNINGCIRASLAPYNTVEEVDSFFSALASILKDSSTEEHIVEESSSEKIGIEKKNVKEESTSLNLLIETFNKAKGWDQKHREIMLLGKAHKRMDKALRDEDTLIDGCESLAWLSINKLSDGKYDFSTDSDARIIRGLLSIILMALNHKTAEQILAFDIDGYFEELGLLQHLSPSRGNGLKAIVNKIYAAVS